MSNTERNKAERILIDIIIETEAYDTEGEVPLVIQTDAIKSINELNLEKVDNEYYISRVEILMENYFIQY